MTTTIDTTCSCGETTPHVIAKRETADGIAVQIWHDGAITGRFGRALPGVPVARPRSDDGLSLARRIASLFSDAVSLYDAVELPQLYACAKRVAQHGGTSCGVVSAFNATDRPTLRLAWDVYATDRDGTPTVRVSRLDRIRWPGLVVWHERGRYELLALSNGLAPFWRSREALTDTGLVFATQRDLRDHLFSIARPIDGVS